MDGAPFTHRTLNQAAVSDDSFAGRDALIALVRLLARQAAREAVASSKIEQENRNNDEDDSLHPNMALFYRQRFGKFREALTDDACRAEATELMRTLVDRIVLSPVVAGGRTRLAIDLHGDIAGILSASAQTQRPPRQGGLDEESVKLVAGGGFEPPTFRL